MTRLACQMPHGIKLRIEQFLFGTAAPFFLPVSPSSCDRCLDGVNDLAVFNTYANMWDDLIREDVGVIHDGTFG